MHNKDRYAKAKIAFEDNLNHLRERDKQVPRYLLALAGGLFELIEAERSESRKCFSVDHRNEVSGAYDRLKVTLVRLFVILIIAGR